MDITPYFDIRGELSNQEGIILKVEAILIPKELRSDMKRRLHRAHLGYDGVMRRARVKVCPGISKDIKQMADLGDMSREKAVIPTRNAVTT